jgi:hypothetical protein
MTKLLCSFASITLAKNTTVNTISQQDLSDLTVEVKLAQVYSANFVVNSEI